MLLMLHEVCSTKIGTFSLKHEIYNYSQIFISSPSKYLSLDIIYLRQGFFQLSKCFLWSNFSMTENFSSDFCFISSIVSNLHPFNVLLSLGNNKSLPVRWIRRLQNNARWIFGEIVGDKSVCRCIILVKHQWIFSPQIRSFRSNVLMQIDTLLLDSFLY